MVSVPGIKEVHMVPLREIAYVTKDLHVQNRITYIAHARCNPNWSFIISESDYKRWLSVMESE